MHSSPTRRRPAKPKDALELASGMPTSPIVVVANHQSQPILEKQKQQRRRRRQRRRNKDPPFYVLVGQVAVFLLFVCWVGVRTYQWLRPPSFEEEDVVAQPEDDDYTAMEAQAIAEQTEVSLAVEDSNTTSPPDPPPPRFNFTLSAASEWDVYGMLEQLPPPQLGHNDAFFQTASQLREEFSNRYGGENAARFLLDQALTTFPSTTTTTNTQQQQSFPMAPLPIHATACRLQQVQHEQRPFRVTFGGYSVTAGRGNRFHDSFPFQFQRLLQEALQTAGIPELHVHNAAIGGCPAFPYAWCFQHFWGPNPDVVSWDYSMNEAGGVPQGLEAYLRHILSTYKTVPKLLVKDTHMAAPRRKLLHDYLSYLGQDPVVIHTDPAVAPFLQSTSRRPVLGFRDWRVFGAPRGAPGQSLHHPALQEHVLLGWLLAMHFLTSLQYLVLARPFGGLDCATRSAVMEQRRRRRPKELPPPMTKDLSGLLFRNDTTLTSPIPEGILFGRPVHNNQDKLASWKMNPIHCKTTFQPILDDGDLSELVVSGTVAEDLDPLLPKSQMYYNQGWVLDLSPGEKAAKRKLSLYEDSLGFIDSKEAYYGIYESPAMQLFVPLLETRLTNGSLAGMALQSLVLCQVNEPRDASSCQLGSDLEIMVGGANATNATRLLKDPGTLYLGEPVCLHVDIPGNATLTSRFALAPPSDPTATDQTGVLLHIRVNNPHIVHPNQACSISHVIWEEIEPSLG